MANSFDPRAGAASFAASQTGARAASYDAGLRKYMLSVYNYMASGVLLTGIVALLFAQSGLAAQVLATPLRWVIMLAPLAFILVLSFGINRLSTGTAQLLFWLFAAVMGLSMSAIFWTADCPLAAVSLAQVSYRPWPSRRCDHGWPARSTSPIL